MTDTEILQLYRSGEREKAFRGLVSTYKERLYWHIRRMVLDHDDTDDCLQNTFVKVWQSLDRFRGDALLYTWLYRIATNESLTFLSRQQTRGGNLDLEAAARLPTPAIAAQGHRQTSPQAESGVQPPLLRGDALRKDR